MPGKYSFAGSILLLALLIALVSAQGGILTRGSTFTVTVVGSSRTAYDIWPKGSHDMTGEAGDQPPIIVAGQVDVVQDPSAGPYTIGNHPISGGGTILGDVPPDSSITPATSYYAEVTTDASGYGVVLFRTSSATATGQQFHIVAENPADLGEDVTVFLGLPPTPAPVRTPMMPLPLPTTMRTPFIPPPALTVPETTFQAPPIITQAPLITPQPMETPTETSPPAGTPIPAVIGIAGAGIGILLAGRTRR